jgi:23S rRNA (cytidine1920-2'-O)/16S rRNA (cytidine1409-2'-O)-methyltransferase
VSGERLDIELVLRGLARSRNHASQLIDQGRVLVAGKPATKPAQKIEPQTEVTLSAGIDYVSRAGQKLLAALKEFDISVSGWALDAGAAAGGFTQVLLERGASGVVAVDVGTDQLDASLRDHPQVISFEGENLRELSPARLAELLAASTHPAAKQVSSFDLVVADLSFISLTLVLGNLSALAGGCDMVLLIKPQFEVGKHSLKAGIVTDAAERERAITQVVAAAAELGYQPKGLIESPVVGTHGNVEYLLWISSKQSDNRQQWEQIIRDRARRVA